ncbi:unnamed protein product [Ixodes pacificus]
MGGRCTRPNMLCQFPLATFFFFFFVEQCISKNSGVENARRLSSYCHRSTSAYGLPGTKLFFSSAISRDHKQKTLLVEVYVYVQFSFFPKGGRLSRFRLQCVVRFQGEPQAL